MRDEEANQSGVRSACDSKELIRLQMGYHGQSEPSALSAPMPIFPAQHLVVAVVRGGVEPPTFRFSALGIPVVMPVLGGKSGVAAAR